MKSHTYPKSLILYWIKEYQNSVDEPNGYFVHKINLNNLSEVKKYNVSTRENQKRFIECDNNFYIELPNYAVNLEIQWNETERKIAKLSQRIQVLNKKLKTLKNSSYLKSLTYELKNFYKKHINEFFTFIKILMFRFRIIFTGPFSLEEVQKKHKIEYTLLKKISQTMYGPNPTDKNKMDLLEQLYHDFRNSFRFPKMMFTVLFVPVYLIPEYPLLFYSDKDIIGNILFAFALFPPLGYAVFIEKNHKIKVFTIKNEILLEIINTNDKNYKFEHSIFVSDDIDIKSIHNDHFNIVINKWFLSKWIHQFGKISGHLFLIGGEDVDWKNEEFIKKLSKIRKENSDNWF